MELPLINPHNEAIPMQHLPLTVSSLQTFIQNHGVSAEDALAFIEAGIFKPLGEFRKHQHYLRAMSSTIAKLDMKIDKALDSEDPERRAAAEIMQILVDNYDSVARQFFIMWRGRKARIPGDWLPADLPPTHPLKK